MKNNLSNLAPLTLLSALVFAPGCSGDPESQEDASSGGATSTGGVPGGPIVATGGGTTGGAGGTGGSGGGSTGGTGSGGDVAVEVEASFETLKFIISGYRPDINCAASDCHSGGHEHSAVPLRLVPDEGLYEELLSHVSVKCGNMPVVDPGNPANSALVTRLRGPCEDVAPPEKPIPRMPYGCFENEWENNCVEDAYIAAVEQWIANGAPEH